MAKTLIVGKNVFPITYNDGITSFTILGINESQSETTEANTKLPFSTAGTFSNPYVRVTANTVTAASTWGLRVNGADGNCAVSITAESTGEFEDLVNTDVISADDDINYQLVTGSGGTSLTISVVSILFDAVGTTLIKYSNNGGTGGTNFSSASTSERCWVTKLVFTGSSLNSRSRMRSAGTWKRLFIYVSANARTTTTTFAGRVNASPGNQSVSITSTATGAFEDTSNTDTISEDDYIDYQITTGTGTETITIQHSGSEFITTDNTYTQAFAFDEEVSDANTRISSISSRLSEQPASENILSVEANQAVNVSRLWLYVDANSADAATVTTFRKNQADTDLAISVGSTSTGDFEDTVDTIPIIASDEINYETVSALTSGSITIRTITSLFTSLPPVISNFMTTNTDYW